MSVFRQWRAGSGSEAKTPKMVQKKDHNESDGPKSLKTCLLTNLVPWDDRWTVVEVPNTIMLKYQPISNFLVRHVLSVSILDELQLYRSQSSDRVVRSDLSSFLANECFFRETDNAHRRATI